MNIAMFCWIKLECNGNSENLTWIGKMTLSALRSCYKARLIYNCAMLCRAYRQNTHRYLCQIQLLCKISLTGHTCIFTMPAVVAIQSIVSTLEKRSFSSITIQIVQKDFSRSLAKVGSLVGICCLLVPKLSASNIGISNTPGIITHCVPVVRIPYLNSTFVGCTAIDKTRRSNRVIWCNTCNFVHKHTWQTWLIQWQVSNMWVCVFVWVHV